MKLKRNIIVKAIKSFELEYNIILNIFCHLQVRGVFTIILLIFVYFQIEIVILRI